MRVLCKHYSDLHSTQPIVFNTLPLYLLLLPLEYVAIATEVTLHFIECTHEELILVKQLGSSMYTNYCVTLHDSLKNLHANYDRYSKSLRVCHRAL